MATYGTCEQCESVNVETVSVNGQTYCPTCLGDYREPVTLSEIERATGLSLWGPKAVAVAADIETDVRECLESGQDWDARAWEYANDYAPYYRQVWETADALGDAVMDREYAGPTPQHWNGTRYVEGTPTVWESMASAVAYAVGETYMGIARTLLDRVGGE